MLSGGALGTTVPVAVMSLPRLLRRRSILALKYLRRSRRRTSKYVTRLKDAQMTRGEAIFGVLQALVAAAAAASAKHGASAEHISVLLQGVLPGASAVNCAPSSLALAAAALAHVLCKAGAGASVGRSAVASAVLRALPQGPAQRHAPAVAAVVVAVVCVVYSISVQLEVSTSSNCHACSGCIGYNTSALSLANKDMLPAHIWILYRLPLETRKQANNADSTASSTANTRSGITYA
eukprot:11422-Heterococcus_DN1.PRE.5